MMIIIIADINEMPTRCFECYYCNSSSHSNFKECDLSKYTYFLDDHGERLNSCPLREIDTEASEGVKHGKI